MRNLPCAICRAQPRFRFASSRSRASPDRSLREPSAGSKLPSEGSRKSRHGSLPTRKKTPFTLTCKGRMSRGTTFSYGSHSMLCLKRVFAHGKIDKQLRIFPSVTGSPVITYPSFDFSNPVQKLPSVSSIPDDLSAGGSSSLAASENVLLFLITFSYIPAILAETHYFVKPK